MQVELIHREPSIVPYAALLLLIGVFGYALVRRWPRLLLAVLPLAVAVALFAINYLLGFWADDVGPVTLRFNTNEVVIGAAAIVFGIGLPLLGASHGRRRATARRLQLSE